MVVSLNIVSTIVKDVKLPVTFNRTDHSDFVPKLGRYPLIVSPIIKDVKLN
jgi:hypothetical protein